ncbi:MAG: hypothetical protein AAGF95_08220 [Chloroflexota bacterium]
MLSEAKDNALMSLQNRLPALLSDAIAWATMVAADVALRGVKLDAARFADAQTVGVHQPEHIRILIVDHMPQPPGAELQAAASQTGLLGPAMVGLTLGYAVLIRRGHRSRRLLSHEFRHVFQYEQAGSIAIFLPQYLASLVCHGYWNCPFEQDARLYEVANP